MPFTSAADLTAEPHPSLVTLTYVTYGLQALGLGVGAFAAVTVMGVFGFGWPSLVGIVIVYMKRAEARGTWLESHLRRQIRTFWIAFVVSCAILLDGRADVRRRVRQHGPGDAVVVYDQFRDLGGGVGAARRVGALSRDPRVHGLERPPRRVLIHARRPLRHRTLR